MDNQHLESSGWSLLSQGLGWKPSQRPVLRGQQEEPGRHPAPGDSVPGGQMGGERQALLDHDKRM